MVSVEKCFVYKCVYHSVHAISVFFIALSLMRTNERLGNAIVISINIPIIIIFIIIIIAAGF